MAIAILLAFGAVGVFCSEPVSAEELALRPEYCVPFVMLGDEARSSAAGEEGDGAVEVILDADTHSVTFHFLCGFASVGINVCLQGRPQGDVCRVLADAWREFRRRPLTPWPRAISGSI